MRPSYLLRRSGEVVAEDSVGRYVIDFLLQLLADFSFWTYQFTVGQWLIRKWILEVHSRCDRLTHFRFVAYANLQFWLGQNDRGLIGKFDLLLLDVQERDRLVVVELNALLQVFIWSDGHREIST